MSSLRYWRYTLPPASVMPPTIGMPLGTLIAAVPEPVKSSCALPVRLALALMKPPSAVNVAPSFSTPSGKFSSADAVPSATPPRILSAPLAVTTSLLTSKSNRSTVTARVSSKPTSDTSFSLPSPPNSGGTETLISGP